MHPNQPLLYFEPGIFHPLFLPVRLGCKFKENLYKIPTIHILQLKMATLKSDTTIVHSQQLIQVVLSSIKNRFGKCFEVRDYRIAAFVHPMFKLNWLSSEDREKAIDQLKVEIEMEENRSGSAAEIESKDDGMLIYY